MFIRAILSLILILMSPIIIISNVLILSTWFRFKRLRTPSNFLIISLSSADLGFGLLMPAAVAVDLTLQDHTRVYSRSSSSSISSTSTNNMNEDLIISNGTIINNMTSFTTEVTLLYSNSSNNNSISNIVQYESTKLNELNTHEECNDTFCMSHFIILLIFCTSAILSMAAIALDRFMSVAQPLRYNHFVTMNHVQKFVGFYWIYALVLSAVVPFFLPSYKLNPEHHIILLSCCVYLPCTFLTVLSYTYIYIIARSHARAIYSVEISLNNGGIIEVSDTSHSSISHPRYGLTLAFIVGTFIACWSPIQICALIDSVSNSNILYQHHWRIVAATPIILNCVINPYLYAYRSSEIRLAVLRTVDTIMTKITGHPPKIPVFIQDKCDLTSCASNIRLLGVSPTQTTIQVSGEGNGGTTEANHLHLFLCDYQVTTL